MEDKGWAPDCDSYVFWVPANGMRGSSLCFEGLRYATRFNEGNGTLIEISSTNGRNNLAGRETNCKLYIVWPDASGKELCLRSRAECCGFKVLKGGRYASGIIDTYGCVFSALGHTYRSGSKRKNDSKDYS